MTTNLRAIFYFGAAALLFSCTAGTKASTPGTGGNGTAGSSGGGTTGTGGTTSGTGGSATDASHDITVGDTSNDGVCSSNTVAAEPAPLDLYFTFDISKSLNLATTAGPSKWDAVKAAVNSFFSDPKSMGIGAGVGYFPIVQNVPATCTADGTCGSFGPCDRRKTCIQINTSNTVVVPLCVDNTSCAANQHCTLIQDCGAPNYCAADGTATCPASCMAYAGYCHARDVCDVTAYATPVVPIAALSGSTAGQAMTLMTSLGQHTPDGYTPTGPALKGAIQYAQQYAQGHPGHKVAVVLVTDGLPLAYTDYFDTATGIIYPGFPRPECNPSDIPGIAAVAAAGNAPAAGTPAVPTFVIGVASHDELVSFADKLNQIATGGGTAPAIQIDTSQNVSQTLQAKLTDIRTKVIACDYQIPTSGVSFDKVNVSFSNGGSDTSIGHVTGADGTTGAACDARGGWYYDKDVKNDAGTPSKITVCPATCQMFQANLSGKVNIVLGCPTIEVD